MNSKAALLWIQAVATSAGTEMATEGNETNQGKQKH